LARIFALHLPLPDAKSASQTNCKQPLAFCRERRKNGRSKFSQPKVFRLPKNAENRRFAHTGLGKAVGRYVDKCPSSLKRQRIFQAA
jgi:hypothetical protein